MNNLIFCKTIFGVVFCLISLTAAYTQNGFDNKPSITVLDFDTSRTRASPALGQELTDMLVNALLNSGRFKVLERSNLNPVQQEQFMGLNGSVDPATGAQVGKLLGAQFIVLGSVREFNEKKKGGLFNIPVIGGLTTYDADLKVSLRVVNSTTGEIVFANPFEKKVSAMGVGDRSTPITQYESKAMDKAIQEVMRETVSAIVERLGSHAPASNTLVKDASLSSTSDCSRRIGANVPRIMVVIPEIHITRRIPDPAGETEIIKKLVQKGFHVVDQKQINAIRDRETVLTAIRNPQAAAALGVEFGADVIIIGEAFSELAARQGNMVSTRGRVEARAIQTDNARILAADGKHASGMDIGEFVAAKTALRNAGSQWADYFIAQFCQASPANTFIGSSNGAATLGSSGIEIMISGISFTQLRQFADRLEKLPGVSSVRKNLTDNIARIHVQYDGSGEKLADTISVTRFGTLPIKIIGLSANKIEISIAR